MRFFLLLSLVSFLTIPVSGKPVPLDSIGIEKINGRVFILHQVEEKETLYSLSRRYKVNIREIIDSNPSSEFGLNIGEILKIPVSAEIGSEDGKITHVVRPQETLYSISKKYNVSPEQIKEWNRISTNILDIGQELIIIPSSEKDIPQKNEASRVASTNSDSLSYHIVTDGETLYSISRKYGVPLDQLREWNGLEVNDIAIGQQLIIGKFQKMVKDQAIPLRIDSAAPKDPPSEVIYAESGAPLSRENLNFDEVTENGLAELIEGSANNRKYLALHRTAKIGTIMRVRNEMNGQEVFVRVIGTLPDTGANRNILIKISRAAYDQLGAIDARFRVMISFIP